LFAWLHLTLLVNKKNLLLSFFYSEPTTCPYVTGQAWGEILFAAIFQLSINYFLLLQYLFIYLLPGGEMFKPFHWKQHAGYKDNSNPLLQHDGRITFL